MLEILLWDHGSRTLPSQVLCTSTTPPWLRPPLRSGRCGLQDMTQRFFNSRNHKTCLILIGRFRLFDTFSTLNRKRRRWRKRRVLFWVFWVLAKRVLNVWNAFPSARQCFPGWSLASPRHRFSAAFFLFTFCCIIYWYIIYVYYM